MFNHRTTNTLTDKITRKIRNNFNFIAHPVTYITERKQKREMFNNLMLIRKLDEALGTNFGEGGRNGRIKQEVLHIPKERANDYSGTPTDIITWLRKINVTNEDAIIDLGCGKGLAMYYMSQFPFCIIDGVELSEQLVKDAERNLNHLFPHDDRFHVFCHDAGTFEGYDSYSVFYIYNSFPQVVVGEVLGRIKESLQNVPRTVIVFYMNPEFPEVFMEDDTFFLVRKGTYKEKRCGMHIFTNTIMKENRFLINGGLL